MNLTLFGVTLNSERLPMVMALVFAAATIFRLSQAPWDEMQAYFALQSKISGQQQQIESASTIPLTRAQLEAKRQEIIGEIEDLRSKFPPRNQILSILLVDLSQIFEASGVRLLSFEPQGFEPLDKGGVKDLGRIKITISARGEYPALIDLFSKLSHYDRIVRVESPSIVPGGSNSGSGAGGGALASPISASMPAGFNRDLDVKFDLTTFALNQ